MPFVNVNGVELYYETAGDPEGPPLLLIAGLASQIIHWPDHFVAPLIEAGYHVVTFDNRDIGLSTQFDGAPSDPAKAVEAASEGREIEAAYRLHDMAVDAVELLDLLEIDSAHLVGISMGAMIAQQIVVDFPARVRSLTSMMGTVGPEAGAPTEAAMVGLFTPPPAPGRDARIAHNLEIAQIWASPGHFDRKRLKQLFENSWDRVGGTQNENGGRHICAVMASGSRAEALATTTVPTLVIHGTADQLITPSGGEHTAAAIPGCRHMTIEGMGHDLVPAFVPQILEAIHELVSNAEPG